MYNEIGKVIMMQVQKKEGDYSHIIQNYIQDERKEDLHEVFNYINGLDIRITKNKGRGVFATKAIMKGELIIVEKPIAFYSKK